MQTLDIVKILNTPATLFAICFGGATISMLPPLALAIHVWGACVYISVPSYFQVNTCNPPVAEQSASIEEMEE